MFMSTPVLTLDEDDFIEVVPTFDGSHDNVAVLRIWDSKMPACALSVILPREQLKRLVLETTAMENTLTSQEQGVPL
jgi:hypothetical protein